LGERRCRRHGLPQCAALAAEPHHRPLLEGSGGAEARAGECAARSAPRSPGRPGVRWPRRPHPLSFLNQHFQGRKNRCYRLAVRAVTRAFVRCTRARSLKKRNLRTLWINRITAASQEHGLKYPAFILNLIKCQVELNRKVLADLAIYEPKTFKSLAALSKRRREEGFVAALGDGKEPEGIFSRVAQHH
uniref:Large ribosomal subunit protein bL20m n=1 Tax=Capra hircus TaxID=9925 RepID=A0A8C2RJN4_CAPHI